MSMLNLYSAGAAAGGSMAGGEDTAMLLVSGADKTLARTIFGSPMLLARITSSPQALALMLSNPEFTDDPRVQSIDADSVSDAACYAAAYTQGIGMGIAAVAASDTAMAAVAASDTAMASIAAQNGNERTIEFLKAANKNRTLLQTIFDTVDGWSVVQNSYQDSVSNLNQYATTGKASGCIILVATGYYSSTSTYTLVQCDGTQVSDGKLVNTRQPQSVTRNNIGAITLAPSTFTENGDGYAAISVRRPQ